MTPVGKSNVPVYGPQKETPPSRFKKNPIGVKDIGVLEVIKRMNEGRNCECRLTFTDGVKVLCELTKVEVADIFNNSAFCGTLTGIDPTEDCFDQLYNVEPGQVFPWLLTALDDSWVRDLYNEQVKKDTQEKKNSGTVSQPGSFQTK